MKKDVNFTSDFIDVLNCIGEMRDKINSDTVSDDNFELGLDAGKIDVLTELEIKMLRIVKEKVINNE